MRGHARLAGMHTYNKLLDSGLRRNDGEGKGHGLIIPLKL